MSSMMPWSPGLSDADIAQMQEERRRRYLTPEETTAETARQKLEDEQADRIRAAQAKLAADTQMARGREAAGLAPLEPAVPMSPLRSNVLPPEPTPDYSHFEEDVRNSLAGAPRGFVDQRARPTPLDPNGPRPVPPSTETKARAVLLPGGKILLTNQEGPGQELAGKELYDAVGKRGAGVSSAQRAGLPASGHHPSLPTLNGTAMQPIPDDLPIEQVAAFTRNGGPSDWRAGTYFEGGPEKDLGHQATDERFALHRQPEYKGAYSQLTPTEDQQTQLALEDAARQAAVYRGQADVETARQQAADAGMSVEERAQATAAARAPELLGMQAIKQEQIRAARALAEWDRRASTPGDPAFVEPNQRALARRKIQDDLEENIKVLAGIVGRQKQLPEGLLGLGG